MLECVPRESIRRLSWDIQANERDIVDRFASRDDPESFLSHRFQRRQVPLDLGVVVLCRGTILGHSGMLVSGASHGTLGVFYIVGVILVCMLKSPIWS